MCDIWMFGGSCTKIRELGGVNYDAEEMKSILEVNFWELLVEDFLELPITFGKVSKLVFLDSIF